MSKIEWNPRKKAHIDFMHVLITELHNEIFLLKSKYRANISNKQKTANNSKSSNKSAKSLFDHPHFHKTVTQPVFDRVDLRSSAPKHPL